MRILAGLAAALFVLSACRNPHPAPGAASPVERLHVVIINGGGTKAQNYQSHLLHVRRLLELLGQAGVPPARTAIFDADGTNPAADMAVRELQPEPDFWLLEGTRLEGPLQTPIVYANTEIPGEVVEPATREAITAWFHGPGRHLRAGDTLLLYVTDHGGKNAANTADNHITLWGDKESLSVSELRALLAGLNPHVRVVLLMSQCFSGSFANLIDVHERGGVPTGTVCGYFSSTPDRPAYGCYPENRGRDNVGHSFEMLEALARTQGLAPAHAQVLASDQTPDVPNRTSDVYLERLLDHAAAGGNRQQLVDDLLRQAWRDKAAWEPDIRLLDATAHAFGMFSPRSLAELDEQTKALPDLSEQLRANGRTWQAACGDAADANLGRFVADHPAWKSRLAPDALTPLDESARRALTAELLAHLGPFTSADRPTAARLAVLRDRGDRAEAAGYRMEVRLAAVLRLRALLASIAGRVYLATRGTPAERAAYEALRTCEDLHLGPTPAGDAPPTIEAFPRFEDDVRLAHEVLPGWMGINFRAAADGSPVARDVGTGPAVVLTVYPDSPAKAAGLEVGDVILGPPGHPFSEPRQIREWTMLSAIDRPAPLVVHRSGHEMRVTLVPKPFPLHLPALPGPPELGSAAPPLVVSAYRGALPARLADGRAHLLFFWATWCAPCKASLPEVLAFEHERNTPVIAITDEPAEQLDRFFDHWHDPFPATVAVDDLRRAFQAYAVSGTPTFVLVDANGRVQSIATGYSRARGLGVTGWSWSERAAATP
jgi:thiol-disulfide isomerase/thioredoxin